VEADGQTGVVSGWKGIAGVKTMYNLEVALDHTFVVGMGMWVVHNCGGGFKVGISPDEIRDINSSLGGNVELTGTAESAFAAAEHYEGFWNKAAVLVRNIAGSHLFNDANKRTASAVVETLMDRNNIMTGVSEGQMQHVILHVARGELRDVPDIASGLRGF
jgi:death-on-curing family protein